MSLELARWRRQFVDGGVIFLHPEGEETATLRVVDRSGELRWDMARAAAVAAFPGCHVESEDQFDTYEGEGAALARIQGTVDGRPVQHSLALVMTERCHREIRAVVSSAQHLDATHLLTRRLAERSLLGLGELRRRRCRQDAPPGWRLVERGLIREWSTENATLWVLPASRATRTQGASSST